jgi:hypothetical protein
MSHTRIRNQQKIVRPELLTLPPAESLIAYADGTHYRTIYADPPWRFTNRTGKMAPEHKRLFMVPERIAR